MGTSRFIASGLRFKSALATVSIAVSFLVMIVAVAISAGFRREIRSGLSDLSGDIQLTGDRLNLYSESAPIPAEPSYIDRIRQVRGVQEIRPVIYRAGIVKCGDLIQGVIFKGVPEEDSLSLRAVIPERLSKMLGLHEGDRMTSYFIGEKVRARNFSVRAVVPSLVESDDALMVTVPLEDLRRLNGWEEGEVSALEVKLEPAFLRTGVPSEVAAEIGSIALLSAKEDDPVLVATSSERKYPQMFDWLRLIDTNVLAILLLMTIVAGFNMISALLILLFRHISTIGTLKAMGMTDRAISGVFLRVSARTVLIGMGAGNAAALLFCLIQGTTHLIRLNPSNYFVSFIPVAVDLPAILLADLIAFVLILALLLIPCLFISRVDPAESVRVK